VIAVESMIFQRFLKDPKIQTPIIAQANRSKQRIQDFFWVSLEKTQYKDVQNGYRKSRDVGINQCLWMGETRLDKKTLGLGYRVQRLHHSAQDLGQDLMSMIMQLDIDKVGSPIVVCLPFLLKERQRSFNSTSETLPGNIAVEEQGTFKKQRRTFSPERPRREYSVLAWGEEREVAIEDPPIRDVWQN